MKSNYTPKPSLVRPQKLLAMGKSPKVASPVRHTGI